MPKPKKSKKSKKSKKRSVFNNPLLNKFLALILISAGLFILIGFAPPPPSSKNPIKINENLYKNQSSQELPVRILLPKENIDINVIPAKVINGFWELSENTASYGEGSGIPGQKGNTVIFAHAREGLFYNLKNVVVNDTIYVFTKNKWYKYKVNKITAVYPNETQVIQPTKNQTLTLYTCTGFSDEKRLIVTAIPQN
jgi:LPXTG-site transpeptidase (sortase) family protein